MPRTGETRFVTVKLVWNGNEWVMDPTAIQRFLQEEHHTNMMRTSQHYRDWWNGVGVKNAPKFPTPEAEEYWQTVGQANWKPS